MSTPKSTVIHIRLEPELHSDVKEEAEADDRKVSDYGRKALKEQVARDKAAREDKAKK